MTGAVLEPTASRCEVMKTYRAMLAALAEDDAAVEAVARAIDWALHDDADEYRVARAAIRAMGGE